MKNKSGISLIVLVITIVVIIILAAAVILSLGDNNPISSANKAKIQSTIGTFKDELGINIANELLKNTALSVSDIDAETEADIIALVPSMKDQKIGNTKYTEILKIEDGKIVLKEDNASYISLTDEQKVILKEAINGVATSNNETATPTWVSNLDTTKLVEAKSETINETKYYAPIPVGFSASTTSGETKISTGLVIKDDTNSNEFVWVPVDYIYNTTTLTKGTDTSKTKLENLRTGWASGSSYTVSTIATLSSSYTETLPAELKTSVEKYGGFYVARYEAGDGSVTSERTSATNGTLVSKKGAYVYNYINWTNADAKSTALYSSSSSVVSNLIYGTQWDSLMYWATIEGKNVSNSVSWGNYENSTGDAAINNGSPNINFTTGRNEAWKTNNIYDLAGNTWEWIAESSSTVFVGRGGDYYDVGTYYPASYRFSISASCTDFSLSFRFTLYIK